MMKIVFVSIFLFINVLSIVYAESARDNLEFTGYWFKANPIDVTRYRNSSYGRYLDKLYGQYTFKFFLINKSKDISVCLTSHRPDLVLEVVEKSNPHKRVSMVGDMSNYLEGDDYIIPPGEYLIFENPISLKTAVKRDFNETFYGALRRNDLMVMWRWSSYLCDLSRIEYAGWFTIPKDESASLTESLSKRYRWDNKKWQPLKKNDEK